MSKKIKSPIASQRNDAMKSNFRYKIRNDGAKLLHLDGWANVFTGQGNTLKDKQQGGFFARELRLGESELTNLYRGDGFAKRIIDLPTGEMVREWFDVMGDTNGDIVKFLHTLNAKDNVLRALRWAELYGGSVILMGIDDGGLLDDPVNEDNIQSIAFLKTFDRFRVNWNVADINTDPNSSLFGEPEWYQIFPINRVGTTQFRVHISRLLIFDGLDVPDRERQNQQGWGDSVINATFNQLKNLSGVYFSAKGVIDEFVMTIMNIDNLQDLIAAGREDEIKARLNLLDLSRHMINTVLLDKEEKYTRQSSSVAGLDRLIDKFAMALSAVTGIPMTLLMGQSPKGMNATGDADIRQWFDHVSAQQEEKMLSQLERLVLLTQLIKQGPTNGKEIDGWSIDFRPLWQPTEKELVETRHIVAKTDEIYITNQVVLPEEIAQSRFGGDQFSIDTSINEDLRTSPDATAAEDDPNNRNKPSDGKRKGSVPLMGGQTSDPIVRPTGPGAANVAN